MGIASVNVSMLLVALVSVITIVISDIAGMSLVVEFTVILHHSTFGSLSISVLISYLLSPLST